MKSRAPRRWRELVAVVIAYTITSQALLAGLAVVSHIVADASAIVICGERGGALGLPGQTDQPDAICPCGPACAMPGCSNMFGVAQAPIVTAVWGTNLHWSDLIPMRIPALPYRVAVRPQMPRAPPNA